MDHVLWTIYRPKGPQLAVNTTGGLVSAINAFSVAGIRIRIDQSWFIAFFLFAWTLASGYYPLQIPDYPAFTYWIAGTLSSLGLFTCVLLHELSHCFVAQRLGVRVRQITLFIFGGVSEMAQSNSSTPKAEFLTTIAGPLSSLGLALVFLTMAYLTKNIFDRMVVETIRYLYYVNFLLAAFNLIPGFPLDGGRVLRSYLWHRTGNLRQATKAAARVGEIFALVLMGFGLLSALTMHIIPGVWLMLVGLFLKSSAENEYKSFELRFGLQDMKLREIMAPAVAVNTSITISQFINEYVFHYHYRVFPVLELGRFVGMIDVRSIKGVPPNEWPTTKINGFLSDPSTYCVLDPDMEATNALRLLTNQNCSKAPIVRNETLYGILTRSDLFKLVSLKQDIAA
jgi:Zn-dependent protease/CBS domain-containing protein